MVRLFRLKEDEDVFALDISKKSGELMEYYAKAEEIKQYIVKAYRYEESCDENNEQ